ncbi:MAG: ATP-binding protein [Alphaproteobacteria bacterium]
MRLNSLALRLVFGAALWSVATLAAGGFVLSTLFRDYVERSFDHHLAVYQETLVGGAFVFPEGLRLSRTLEEARFQQPYSGWYWQIEDRNGPVLSSRSLWDETLNARPPQAEETTRFRIEGPLGQSLRASGRWIALPGGEAPFLFLVAGDASEIETEIADFNTHLFWSLGGLGLVLVAAMLIQVVYGLQPLRRLGRQLAQIRAGRAHHLGGDFPAEIAPLATELNALLDHNAEVIERARTHVGNLAHALKTPLAVLTNEAASAPADPGADGLADQVRRQTELMRRHVDHYLVRARAAGAGRVLGIRTEVAPVVEDLKRTLLRIHRDRALDIAVRIEPDVSFRGERQDLEEILGNLIDNACKWARHHILVTATLDGRSLEIAIEDDGRGLSPDERAAVLPRGSRLDESVPGSGLGLSIVRDIAGLYGGTLVLGAAPGGGLRAAVRLPAARN